MTGGPPGPKPFWPEWLTARRLAQFATNHVRIENDVSSLKAEVRQLREQMASLREHNAVLTARIEMLTGFLNAVVAERSSRTSDAALALLLDQRRKGQEEDTP